MKSIVHQPWHWSPYLQLCLTIHTGSIYSEIFLKNILRKYEEEKKHLCYPILLYVIDVIRDLWELYLQCPFFILSIENLKYWVYRCIHIGLIMSILIYLEINMKIKKEEKRIWIKCSFFLTFSVFFIFKQLPIQQPF